AACVCVCVCARARVWSSVEGPAPQGGRKAADSMRQMTLGASVRQSPGRGPRLLFQMGPLPRQRRLGGPGGRWGGRTPLWGGFAWPHLVGPSAQTG
uniref:Uncharacterized protein n=1 Tax=Catagonus wagneri TaxID=51154 RepID=A0A8C3WE12_9CETA